MRERYEMGTSGRASGCMLIKVGKGSYMLYSKACLPPGRDLYKEQKLTSVMRWQWDERRWVVPVLAG
jgi:hypothetical protein